MTPAEAIDKLEKGATRKHVVEYGVMGPSMGDPGGQRFITKACAAHTYQWSEILSTDESKCDCPAKKHNEIVHEAAEILRKAITA